MGVHDVRVPLARDGAKLARRPNVPFSAQRQPVGRQSRQLGAPDQGAASRGHDQNPIAQISQSSGEQQNLALTTTPTAPGIDVENPGKIHYA
jgi:hypothetical protein